MARTGYAFPPSPPDDDGVDLTPFRDRLLASPSFMYDALGDNGEAFVAAYVARDLTAMDAIFSRYADEAIDRATLKPVKRGYRISDAEALDDLCRLFEREDERAMERAA
jgi:hypothetical protein